MNPSNNRELYSVFRQLLSEARLAKNIKQSDLAKQLRRKSQSYVSNYERGERRVDIVEFFDIAEALDIDIQEFIAALLKEKRKLK